MAAIPTSPQTIRAGLLKEIDAAESLNEFTKEALRRSFVPFAELFCTLQAEATPAAGRLVADAAAACAAAIIGHLHMNVSRPGVDKDAAIRDFMKVVEGRVRRSLAADGVLPADGGRWL